MNFYLKKLGVEDGIEIYSMLQRIRANENEFKNTAYGLTYNEFVLWLKQQDEWSQGIGLPKGYVPQTIFWLYVNNKPVGIGKIRHKLNDNSRRVGGNIGYAIDPKFRGKGYGSILLKYLNEEATALGINEKLITVEKYNPISKKVVEKSGGILIKEDENRWFFTFEK